MATALPANLADIYQRLYGDVASLHLRWATYRKLFATSQQRTDVLNNTAPSFFRILHDILADDVIIGIARVTDKVRTSGQSNLVLRQLVDGLDRATHDKLIAELETKLNDIENLCAPIQRHRHKRLAHRDQQNAVDPAANPLPGITVPIINQTLECIADFMNSFQQPFLGNHVVYSETIPGLGDAESLILALRRAGEYRKLERDGKAPHLTRWTERE
jgi:AbiU2